MNLACFFQFFFHPSILARPVGLACVDDYDGDKVKDSIDVCPYASNIHTTSFADYTMVDLTGPSSNEPEPKWRVTNKVGPVLKGKPQSQQTISLLI